MGLYRGKSGEGEKGLPGGGPFLSLECGTRMPGKRTARGQSSFEFGMWNEEAREKGLLRAVLFWSLEREEIWTGKRE